MDEMGSDDMQRQEPPQQQRPKPLNGPILNLENAKHIDQNSQDIVNGFISIIRAEPSIPALVRSVCLLYYARDRIDENAMGDVMGSYRDCITLTGGLWRRPRPNSALLTNVVDKGRYSWTFKMKNISLCHH